MIYYFINIYTYKREKENINVRKHLSLIKLRNDIVYPYHSLKLQTGIKKKKTILQLEITHLGYEF